MEASSRPTDEQIVAFETEVKENEAKQHELVSLPMKMDVLLNEYENGSAAFYEKMKRVVIKYRQFRRCRPDGDCFYRAFAFAWFERMLASPTALELGKKRILWTKTLLEMAGFQELAYGDFLDSVLELLQRISDRSEDSHTLLANFQNPEISNSVVVHLRFVTSAYLKTREDEYLPFILDTWGTIRDYCANCVEAMGQESEDLMITALSTVLGIPVEVVYLDASQSTDTFTTHRFVRKMDEAPWLIETERPLCLLYRPGHYDIAYKTY